MSNRDGYHAGPGDPEMVDKSPKNASFQSYAKQSAGSRGMSEWEGYDRFIAKVKADAIREANSAVLAPSSVTIALEQYADRIEAEA